MMISKSLWDLDWARPQLYNLLSRVATDEAYKEIVRVAKEYSSSDPESMGRLARAYRDGKGVKQDLNKATELMRKSANAGIPWAKWEFFQILWSINTAESLSEMIAYAQQESDKGNMELRARLARAYRDGKGVEQDLNKAAELMRSVSSADVPRWAKIELFDILWKIGTPESYSEMITLAEIQSSLGNVDLMERLGRAYREGKGRPKNMEMAAIWFKKASDGGSIRAKWEYFELLWKIGTPESLSEMIAYAQQESDKGNMELRARLARAYRDGKGVEQDLNKAAELMRSAASKNIPSWAKYELFDILWKIGTPDAYDEMIIIATDKTVLNDPLMMGRLARAYRDGKGVEQDLNTAVFLMKNAMNLKPNWIENELFDLLLTINTDESTYQMIALATKLANAGNAEMMGRLARAYRDGKGVEINLEMAKKWMSEASNKGVGWAKWEYFDLLWSIGTPESLAEMIAYAQQESDKGNMELRARLARAYRDGKGVVRDLNEAANLMRTAVLSEYPRWAKVEFFDILWTIGTPESYKEMFMLASSQASSANVDMMLRLSMAYRDGIGTDSNLPEALKWAQCAKNHEVVIASSAISSINKLLKGTPKSKTEFKLFGTIPKSEFCVFYASHKGMILNLIDIRYILCDKYKCILIINQPTFSEQAKKFIDNGIFDAVILHNMDLGFANNESDNEEKIIASFDDNLSTMGLDINHIYKSFSLCDQYDSFGAYLRKKGINNISVRIPNQNNNVFLQYYEGKSSFGLTRMYVDTDVFYGPPTFSHIDWNTNAIYSESSFDFDNSYKKLSVAQKKKIYDSLGPIDYDNKNIILMNSSTMMNNYGINKTNVSVFTYVVIKYLCDNSNNFLIKLHPYSLPKEYFGVPDSWIIPGNINVDLIKYTDQKMNKVIAFGSTAIDKVKSFSNESINLGLNFYQDYIFLPIMDYFSKIIPNAIITQTVVDYEIGYSCNNNDTSIQLDLKYNPNVDISVFIDNNTIPSNKNCQKLLFKISKNESIVNRSLYVVINNANTISFDLMENEYKNDDLIVQCNVSMEL